MDQTKLINAYIANMAERVKALTLDTIMLSTQLALANENIDELNKQVETMQAQIDKLSSKAKAKSVDSGSGEYS